MIGLRNLSDIDGYSSMQSMRVTISESVISWWSHDLSVISDLGEEANTHSVISFVVGWSYFIVSWIEFDKTSGGLPTSPNRSSSNAAALESNRCLNMVYGQGHPNRAIRTGPDVLEHTLQQDCPASLQHPSINYSFRMRLLVLTEVTILSWQEIEIDIF